MRMCHMILYVVIQCIYVHGETETKVIKWEWQNMK